MSRTSEVNEILDVFRLAVSRYVVSQMDEIFLNKSLLETKQALQSAVLEALPKKEIPSGQRDF